MTTALLAEGEGQIQSPRDLTVKFVQPGLRVVKQKLLQERRVDDLSQETISYASETPGHSSMPAQGSQCLQWAWELKASSLSSASRCGPTVCSVDKSQFLERTRKSCYHLKELSLIMEIMRFPRY